jgi:hypothetical protein
MQSRSDPASSDDRIGAVACERWLEIMAQRLPRRLALQFFKRARA